MEDFLFLRLEDVTNYYILSLKSRPRLNITVNSQVVVNSLAVKKNKEANFNFVKYDIEVSIEEIENKDTKSKLKFVITLLSEPKKCTIINRWTCRNFWQ